MSSEPVRVLAIVGHPVIVGVLRLACDAEPSLRIVGEAFAGTRGLELLRKAPADVVVVDLELAEPAGVQVVRSLREDGYVGGVLAISDRSDGATVLQALRWGADGYLTKADGLREVGPALLRVARGQRVVDPSLEQAAVRELGRFARQVRQGNDAAGTVTPRERQILQLLAEGLTMRQVARRLEISPRTVETHVAKLYRKLDVRTRVQAIARAASIGLIDLE
ncbi:MAG TPA: response regulator transcription factor [Actinomycetota bacterium]|jgi:DNA-binding NarL/FixJ family response regulator